MKYQIKNTTESFSNHSVYRETFYYIEDKYKDEDIVKDNELDKQTQTADDIVSYVSRMSEIGFMKEMENANSFADLFKNFLIGFNFSTLCAKALHDGSSKIIKRTYNSPVYYIKPLEGPVHLEYLKNNNISAAFNILENESGWTTIKLTNFKIKSLSNLSEKSMMKLMKMMKLRNYKIDDEIEEL